MPIEKRSNGTALATGASGGIGLRLAEQLAERAVKDLAPYGDERAAVLLQLTDYLLKRSY